MEEVLKVHRKVLTSIQRADAFQKNFAVFNITLLAHLQNMTSQNVYISLQTESQSTLTLTLTLNHLLLMRN